MKPAERDEAEARLLTEAARLRPWSPAARARVRASLAARAAGPSRVAGWSWAVAGLAAAAVLFFLVEGSGRSITPPPREGPPAEVSSREAPAPLPSLAARPVRPAPAPLISPPPLAPPELAPTPPTTPSVRRRALQSLSRRALTQPGPAASRAAAPELARAEPAPAAELTPLAAGGPSLVDGPGEEPGPPAVPPEPERSPPPMPALPALPPAAAPATPCDALGPAARGGCLQDQSAGPGLAGQNALFALGLAQAASGQAEAALATWTEYDRRFSRGVLAPEVARARLSLLVAQGQRGPAVAAAERALALDPDGPTSDQVRLLLARVLLEGEGHDGRAEAIYQRVAAGGATPHHREEALFFLGVLAHRRGDEAEARRRFARCRADFPAGHRAELAREWLESLGEPRP